MLGQNPPIICLLQIEALYKSMKAISDIYFLNAHKLAGELRDGSISETLAVKHMVVSMMLAGIGFEIPISVEFEPVETSFFEYIGYAVMFVVSAIITYYGVWLTYQVNSKGDGKDYFKRFIALSLPVGVQLLFMFLGVGLVILLLTGILTSTFGVVGMYVYTAIFYLAIFGFIALYFIKMRKYIGIASGGSSAGGV